MVTFATALAVAGANRTQRIASTEANPNARPRAEPSDHPALHVFSPLNCRPLL